VQFNDSKVGSSCKMVINRARKMMTGGRK